MHARFVSLQPLQHPDPAPDGRDVPRGGGARLRARRAAGAGGARGRLRRRHGRRVRSQAVHRLAAQAPGRVPHVRRRAGAAVRRQGAQPQGPRRHLFRRRATSTRRCRRWCSRSPPSRSRSRTRRPRRCCSSTTSSRRTSRASTSCCATTRAFPTSSCATTTISRGWRSIAAPRSAAGRYFGPFPECGRGARHAAISCRSCSASAIAATASSPTARGRACSTRSVAARRPASG